MASNDDFYRGEPLNIANPQDVQRLLRRSQEDLRRTRRERENRQSTSGSDSRASSRQRINVRCIPHAPLKGACQVKRGCVGVSCPRLRSDFSIQINPTVLKAVLLRHQMQFEVGGVGFSEKIQI